MHQQAWYKVKTDLIGRQAVSCARSLVWLAVMMHQGREVLSSSSDGSPVWHKGAHRGPEAPVQPCNTLLLHDKIAIAAHSYVARPRHQQS